MGKLFKLVGILLVFSGLALLFFIYFPLLREEVIYQTNKASFQEEEKIEPVSKDFGLVIPKIDINAKVFADVDANNPEEYLPLLTEGVAHSKGSSFPYQSGNVFIFAHSSDTPFNILRYNAIFYLIDKLEENDEIFIFYQGDEYLYEVKEKKIVPPEFLQDFVNRLEGDNLILQTCSPPGTTINRLLVIAKAVD